MFMLHILPLFAVVMVLAIAYDAFVHEPFAPVGDSVVHPAPVSGKLYTVQVQKGKGSFVSVMTFTTPEDAEAFVEVIDHYTGQTIRIHVKDAEV